MRDSLGGAGAEAGSSSPGGSDITQRSEAGRGGGRGSGWPPTPGGGRARSCFMSWGDRRTPFRTQIEPFSLPGAGPQTGGFPGLEQGRSPLLDWDVPEEGAERLPSQTSGNNYIWRWGSWSPSSLDPRAFGNIIGTEGVIPSFRPRKHNDLCRKIKAEKKTLKPKSASILGLGSMRSVVLGSGFKQEPMS